MKLEYIVNSTEYKTVKEVLRAHFQISERFLLKLKKHNRILLNGIPTFVDKQLIENDTITINIDFDEKSENIVSTKMNLEIIFEDDALLIVNKPAGLPIHPSRAHFENSLSNGVQYYFEKTGVHTKIRPVNRLDLGTSRPLHIRKKRICARAAWFAKWHATHSKNGTKLFCAAHLKYGEGESGRLAARIARKAGSIIEREISPTGKEAITHYKLLKNYGEFCLVEFKLETGRTHQIRIHSKFMGHPILGDTLYGTTSNLISHQALHAYKIAFFHPISGKKMTFETPLPDDMQQILDSI